jgi:hypothetical protein
MKLKEWLDEWSMTSLKIKTRFLEMDWQPNDVDKDAAWELYIELLTRITTQELKFEHGDEMTALLSVHKIFEITRDVIKTKGRHSINFTKIAIVVLNQVIRPFTSKWHKLSLQDAFNDKTQCEQFRQELGELQGILRKYTRMLSDMADVEDLTDLEKTD